MLPPETGTSSPAGSATIRAPCEHAVLFDPGGVVRQATTAHALLPSARLTTSAPRAVTFRGSITRPTHSLSTLRRVGYPPPRKTRFQLAANLGWAGFAPAGPTSEGFAMLYSYVIVPPSPGFAWRNKRGDGRGAAPRYWHQQRGAPWKGADGPSAGWFTIPSSPATSSPREPHPSTSAREGRGHNRPRLCQGHAEREPEEGAGEGKVRECRHSRIALQEP